MIRQSQVTELCQNRETLWDTPYPMRCSAKAAKGINFSKKKIGCYRPVAALSDWLLVWSEKPHDDLRLTPSIDPKSRIFFFSGHWITNPNNSEGKSLKFTIRLHCWIPPKWVQFHDPCMWAAPICFFLRGNPCSATPMKITLQGTITHPTESEKENHRLKQWFLMGHVIVPRRVTFWTQSHQGPLGEWVSMSSNSSKAIWVQMSFKDFQVNEPWIFQT